MATSKSLSMPGNWPGNNRIFVKSQFCAKPQWPPQDTDLSGQVGIVTGATTGIGLDCCRQLLSFKLSHLILAVRSQEKGDATATKFREAYPKATIEVWLLEMESYQSVQDFARRAGSLRRLDLAILNVGITALDHELVPETGHERVIQVNYLSTMLLAILLLPTLKAKHPAASKPGRLTVVNSGVSLMAKFPNHKMRPLLKSFDDKKIFPWENFERYFSSKLLGQLFFIKLFPYVDPDDVTFNLVDPGLVKGTGLQRDATGILRFFFASAKALTGRSVVEGASTYVDAVTIKGKESHGCFLMDWKIVPFANFTYTEDGKAAMEQLWEETLAEFEFADARRIIESLRE